MLLHRANPLPLSCFQGVLQRCQDPRSPKCLHMAGMADFYKVGHSAARAVTCSSGGYGFFGVTGLTPVAVAATHSALPFWSPKCASAACIVSTTVRHVAVAREERLQCGERYYQCSW